MPVLGLLRTGAIEFNTRKSVQSGKKVQQNARELRSIGIELQRRKPQEDAQKTTAESFRTHSDLFLSMEGKKRFLEGVVSQIDAFRRLPEG